MRYLHLYKIPQKLACTAEREPAEMAPRTYLPILLLPLVMVHLTGAAQIRSPARPAGQRLPRVLIVGAGLAGSAAARDFTDAGINDLLVLEARSRPGGRLHSVQTKAGEQQGYSRIALQLQVLSRQSTLQDHS